MRTLGVVGVLTLLCGLTGCFNFDGSCPSGKMMSGCTDAESSDPYRQARAKFYSDPSISPETKMQALQMENENWNREADREVQQRAIRQSGMNAAIIGAAQNSAAERAAQAGALNNLQQQQQSFQVQQQLRQLNQGPPPDYTYTPRPVGITGPLY
jgi:hypothetical protein